MMTTMTPLRGVPLDQHCRRGTRFPRFYRERLIPTDIGSIIRRWNDGRRRDSNQTLIGNITNSRGRGSSMRLLLLLLLLLAAFAAGSGSASSCSCSCSRGGGGGDDEEDDDAIA